MDAESSAHNEMSLAVRRHTIVLNLGEIRCLVLWDRLIVIIPDGADSDCFQRLEEVRKLWGRSAVYAEDRERVEGLWY